MACLEDHCVELPAQSWSLGELRQFCRAVLRSQSVRDPLCRQVVLAIDEAAANVVEHAYPPDRKESLALKLRVDEENITVELRDTGCRFNPVDRVGVRPRGQFPRRGYGIAIIHRIMDGITYRRTERGENVLTLTKRRTSSSAAQNIPAADTGASSSCDENLRATTEWGAQTHP